MCLFRTASNKFKRKSLALDKDHDTITAPDKITVDFQVTYLCNITHIYTQKDTGSIYDIYDVIQLKVL